MPRVTSISIAILALTASALPARGEGTLPQLPDVARHQLWVWLDPAAGRVEVEDTIDLDVVPGDSTATHVPVGFFLGAGLEVTAVRQGLVRLSYDVENDTDIGALLPHVHPGDHRLYRDAQLIVCQVPAPASGRRSQVTLVYEGGFGDDDATMPVARPAREQALSPSFIAADGVLLSPASQWYPTGAPGFATFHMRVSAPAPIEIIGAGTMLSRHEEAGQVTAVWSEEVASTGAYLLAGPYQTTQRIHGEVELATYFHAEDAHLAGAYLDAAGAAIERYSAAFGPYRRRQLSIVATSRPVGIALPSAVVLGRALLGHDATLERSLAHEIAHCWWGHTVVPDPADGNWSEGLVTYLADHRLLEVDDPARARELRYDTLARYQELSARAVAAGVRQPALRDFRWGASALDSAVGYGKGFMLFHMLERMIGRVTVGRALRQIYTDSSLDFADWRDFESHASWAVGDRLDWFFEAWLMHDGAPELVITSARRVATEDGRHRIDLELAQSEPALQLDVPVRIDAREGTFDRVVRLEGAATSATLRSTSEPLAVRLDPDYDLFRALHPDERAPSLAAILDDEDLLVMLPSTAAADPEPYRQLVGTLVMDGVRGSLLDHAWRDDLLSRRRVLLIGGPDVNSATATLEPAWREYVAFEEGAFVVDGQRYEAQGHAALVAVPDPGDAERPIALLLANDLEAAVAAVRRVGYYDRQSFVVFADGERVAAGRWPGAAQGLTWTFE